MEITVKLKNETKKQIELLIIDDYTQQLEQLKQEKNNYDYTTYRKQYVKLYNAILWHKKEYKNLLGE